MKVTEVFEGNKMFYKTIDVWTVAIKQNNTWVNYYTKIMPTSETTGETGRVVETDRIKVLHESQDIGDFSRILEALKGEKMNICGFEIEHNVARNFNPDQNVEYLYREWNVERYGTEYPFYKYEIRTSSTPSSPRNIEQELMSLGKPYKNQWDVMEGLLRIKSGSYNWGSVLIMLPIFLSLRECSFDQNTLRLTADFHNKMIGRIVFGLILRNSKGESKRYSKPIEKSMLKASGNFCHCEDFEPVNDDIISADVILHHMDIPSIVHSKEVIRLGLSRPLAIFKKFWSEDYLLNCLRGENGDQAFEWSVSTLLTFSGYPVLWIGWGKGRIKLGGADQLALYKDSITVVECTTGAVGTEKIDRLLGAVKTIQETLGLSEKSTQKITPLIFTCSEVSPATRESGEKSGVRIRGPEEIAQIYDAVIKNKPTQEIVNLIRGNGWYL